MADEERYRKDNKKREKQLTKQFDLGNYHPIASKPRRLNKTRGGVPFYVEKQLKFTPRHLETEIERTITEVDFGEKFWETFVLCMDHHREKWNVFYMTSKTYCNS